nr:MAG TPA: hypothetical protein [Microviridae sp.]
MLIQFLIFLLAVFMLSIIILAIVVLIQRIFTIRKRKVKNLEYTEEN